jgi:hypothetical protein
LATEDSRQLVKVLSANAISHEVIAEILGISPATLRRYYRKDFENAREHIKARMAAAIVKKGLGGDLNAAKYWMSVHYKEWRVKDDDDPPPGTVTQQGETVRFYMPSNGRDQPDDDDAPMIEGTAEEAA